ncbi:MAG: sigma-54 dependent transcriptional regulator [Candidatus Zixiibacteriota bacterium]
MNDRNLRVLIIDDDADFREDLKLLLPAAFESLMASSLAAATKLLNDREIGLVFLDIDLGGDINGLEYLKKIKADQPYLPVIMVTADRSVDSIVQAMRLGASDYVGKSPDLDKLELSITRALSESSLLRRLDLLESDLGHRVGDLIGESEAIKTILKEMKRLGAVPSNVLITGKSGTGKELVARGIHKLSDRQKQPFVAVNCAALSRELIESELFGHEKGAFTGAVGRRSGKFELVGSGTLFLDEITEIPVELQAKLLRAIQEREFSRVGGNSIIKFQGRLLASSNRNFPQAISEGHFREDLYYRINVASIHIPSLADRRNDIPVLAKHFVSKFSREMKKPICSVSERAIEHLMSYDWPGNVRELANAIENAVVHCDDTELDLHHFGPFISHRESLPERYEEAKQLALSRFQRDFISAALSRHGGNVSKTADEIGISRQGLIKMMETCGLSTK